LDWSQTPLCSDGRVVVGVTLSGSAEPPRPARSAKRCESGERVTEPTRRGHPHHHPPAAKRAAIED